MVPHQWAPSDSRNSSTELARLGCRQIRVVTARSAGASVNNYYLGGYAPSQVTPPGKLSVVRLSAALSGGRLQAMFQLRLPQNPQDMQGGPTPVLYAVGLLDASGSLLPHPDSQVSAASCLCTAYMMKGGSRGAT